MKWKEETNGLEDEALHTQMKRNEAVKGIMMWGARGVDKLLELRTRRD